MKKILQFAILLSGISLFNSQIIVNTTVTEQNKVITAPSSIRFLPGFGVKSLNVGTFRAYISPNSGGGITPIDPTPSTGMNSTENYIFTTQCLDANCIKKTETVQYFDGLGRPKQVVNIKASPTGKDVVTHIEYDGFGRQVKDYLPVPQGQTLNGSLVPNPLTNASQLYGQEKIFAEKTIENSPLDRLLEQRQVGTAWNDKPVTFQYDANIAGEVKKYIATSSWSSGTTASVLSLSGNYPANQLYKNTVTDEDGNQSIEFKNGQGQIVLARKVLSASENADTYYIYNEYNKLAFVVPPMATKASDVNSVLSTYCYLYRYDGRGRLVLKKLPGKGWEYMVYDKQDRLIMTQDAIMGANKQWLFTKYDQFGRTVYTGIYTSDQAYGPAGRLAEQTAADTKGSNNVTRTSNNTIGFTDSGTGMAVYYDNGTSSYPNTITRLLSVNYYDTYPPYTFNPAFPSNALTDNSTGNSVSTKSLPVMSLVKNIEDDNWTKSYTFYDNKGRVTGTYSINHLGGYTKTDSQLDFVGVLQTITTEHKRLTGDTKKVITEAFTYDHQNRLKIHKHKVDNNPEEILVQNDYNELSQLRNKKVGGTIPSSPLQSIDYFYNIRGWMTHINDPQALNGKLFGYSIKYNNPESPDIAPGKFNGNISEVDWITSNDGVLRRYNYQYDALNRLNKGLYSEPGSSVIQNKFFNEELTYDLNGNIQTLKRNSKPSQGTTAEVIDDLIYNYENNNQSNRLASITLPTGVVNNSSGYNALGKVISYDNNGRMISQLDKGINKIIYNYLDLPNNVTKGTGALSQIINYTYRADGAKIKKNISGGGMTGISQTDYLDGFQYQDGVLQFVSSAEGYFDFTKNKYIYNYTDHLGNVRLSYTNNGARAEAIEENNYYPFGLKHERYNNIGGNQAYQYKYNDKELQSETGMYDYGARFYMPDLGRWGVIDPLSELQFAQSPYSYVYGNPIRFNDPTGMIGKEGEPELDPNARGGANNPALIQEVVMTRTKASSLSFMGINNMNAYHASEDRLAAGIRGSKAALATEKFERNLAFTMGTFLMGGSNLLASAGWATFDAVVDYQDPEDQEAIQAVQFAVIAVQLKHGNISALKKAVNLPSLKKIIVDMEHIASGHMVGGSRVSALKTLFPENLSREEVKKLILEAYKNSKRIKTQEERVLLQGNDIEMWVNTKTKTIETAYPIRK